MIENVSHTIPPQNDHPYNKEKSRRIMQMVQNDRTAGFIPSWEIPKTAKQEIESAISTSLQQNNSDNDFQNILAYQDEQNKTAPHASRNEEFNFSDLADFINPLQHIPLVSNLYREITGDEIKPIGKIVGGAIFGGPAGAASGLVNIVIEEETGKDIVGNAVAFVQSDPRHNAANDEPEIKLSKATAEPTKLYDDLPASLLAFTENKATKTIPQYEQSRIADGRTAGYITRYS